MKEYKKENSISENVLSKIKSGNTKMIPKWHFVFSAILFSIGVFILTVLLVYIVSLVIFILKRNGSIFAPIFGLKGIGIFLNSLPWILILLGLSFILVLETLIRHYSFTYKRPIFYSLFGLVVIISLLGVMVYKAEVHDGLLKYGEGNKLAFVKSLYRDYGLQKLDNIYIGIIKDINDGSFLMDNSHKEDIEIFINENTRLPIKNGLEEGDQVVVFGEFKDGHFEAIGVKRLNQKIIQKLDNIEKKQTHPLLRDKNLKIK